MKNKILVGEVKMGGGQTKTLEGPFLKQLEGGRDARSEIRRTTEVQRISSRELPLIHLEKSAIMADAV